MSPASFALFLCRPLTGRPRSRSSLLSRVSTIDSLHDCGTFLLTTTAVQHMETYWAILERVRGSALRLTKMDDDIYEHLLKDFPEYDPTETIDEDKMKSKEGKDRWRKFMMEYEKKVDDYNFGTMLRSNAKWEYGQDTTIFGEF